MNNPEKLALKGTHDEQKTKKQTQYVLDNNKLKNVSKTWALLQATGNKDDELFLCGNRYG